MKQIGQSKGLSLQPKHDFTLDMYVDADFAGLRHRDFAELCECALSHTGYIITCCGCLIHWASKRQSKLALSMIPLCHLVQELHKHIASLIPL